ncbi:hypothetical protein FK535_14165 [Mycolicibacterium sp. 018/SC-01/001]|uniref:hypothetical protein n=1 Tax=Mycolicibacterium sp. 018/SC-01/001 TaxID=2592069 RepID=UPI001180A344|nr:hypothetical protein [Mycolicibacterium sp. 018/SC-01/001]TRW82028.1 hypothetical protein FK535_14165 [Mycolicibacterium sp. 018/SC-01/001]
MLTTRGGRLLPILSLVAALAACGGTTAGQAAPTTPTLPPGFPDLSALAQVDTKDYFESFPYFRGVHFTTPDGLECDSNDMNSLDDPAVRRLTCDGPRPDKGPGTWKVAVSTDTPASIEPGTPPLNPTYTPDASTQATPLPPQHRIDYEGIRCGVDEKGTTACTVGEHGFLLTPTTTLLF